MVLPFLFHIVPLSDRQKSGSPQNMQKKRGGVVYVAKKL